MSLDLLSHIPFCQGHSKIPGPMVLDEFIWWTRLYEWALFFTSVDILPDSLQTRGNFKSFKFLRSYTHNKQLDSKLQSKSLTVSPSRKMPWSLWSNKSSSSMFFSSNVWRTGSLVGSLFLIRAQNFWKISLPTVMASLLWLRIGGSGNRSSRYFAIRRGSSKTKASSGLTWWTRTGTLPVELISKNSLDFFWMLNGIVVGSIPFSLQIIRTWWVNGQAAIEDSSDAACKKKHDGWFVYSKSESPVLYRVNDWSIDESIFSQLQKNCETPFVKLSVAIGLIWQNIAQFAKQLTEITMHFICGQFFLICLNHNFAWLHFRKKSI